MAERNPHRRTARIVALVCYFSAGFVIFVGTFFTLAAALTSPAQLPAPFENMTNRGIAVLAASPFLVIALMIASSGWFVQSLWGRERREEKLAARASVGCLRLASLGCGLWTVLSAVMILVTGKLLFEPAGIREILIGSSGPVILCVIMLVVAWFVSENFVRQQPEESGLAYRAYLDIVQRCRHQLADPKIRNYLQEQTMEVLTKLDAPRKSAVLEFLSEAGLLTGDTRVSLVGADFRRVELPAVSLPLADLRGINLEWANLQGASLYKASLITANLKNADLTRANLQGADLRGADLTEAVLEKTNLIEADLTGARVTQGQLHQARLKSTTLPNGNAGNQ